MQESHYVTVTDIDDDNTACHTRGQWGQVLRGDWRQVHIIQLQYPYRAQHPMVSQAGRNDDLREEEVVVNRAFVKPTLDPLY